MGHNFQPCWSKGLVLLDNYLLFREGSPGGRGARSRCLLIFFEIELILSLIIFYIYREIFRLTNFHFS